MSSTETSGSAGSSGTLKVTLILGIALFMFSSDLISELGQVLKNRPVTATITDRIQTCRVDIRNADRTRTRKTMPCREAYALKKIDESSRTRVYQSTYVVLSYPLRNGTHHTARVREHKVRARKIPVGHQIQVAYSKRNPNTVAMPRSWWGIIKSTLLVGGCLFGLMLSLYGYQAVSGFFKRASGRYPTSTREPSKAQRTYDDLMANLDKIVDGSGWRGDVGSGWKKPKPVAHQRRQHKKPAPIPVTGGVVSKRRGGLFGLLG